MTKLKPLKDFHFSVTNIKNTEIHSCKKKVVTLIK